MSAAGPETWGAHWLHAAARSAASRSTRTPPRRHGRTSRRWWLLTSTRSRAANSSRPAASTPSSSPMSSSTFATPWPCSRRREPARAGRQDRHLGAQRHPRLGPAPLLQGRWTYTATGPARRDPHPLLQPIRCAGHVRRSRVGGRRLRASIADPLDVEVVVDADRIPPSVIEWVRHQRDALVYQYVVSAHRAATDERLRPPSCPLCRPGRGDGPDARQVHRPQEAELEARQQRLDTATTSSGSRGPPRLLRLVRPRPSSGSKAPRSGWSARTSGSRSSQSRSHGCSARSMTSAPSRRGARAATPRTMGDRRTVRLAHPRCQGAPRPSASGPWPRCSIRAGQLVLLLHGERDNLDRVTMHGRACWRSTGRPACGSARRRRRPPESSWQ